MVLKGPGPGPRRSKRSELARRVAPWAALTVGIGILAVGLGVPWWISVAVGVLVLFWIIVEP